MPTNKLDRLLFAQGGGCFFCREPLSRADASVEHLVATANGGKNDDENCVACCKALNRLFGSMSLKEKVQVVLNQRGRFVCPSRATPSKKKSRKDTALPAKPATDRMAAAIEDLRRRGEARPGTLKTLTSTMHALFNKKLAEPEVTALVKKMQEAGHIVLEGTKVSYVLPPSDV